MGSLKNAIFTITELTTMMVVCEVCGVLVGVSTAPLLSLPLELSLKVCSGAAGIVFIMLAIFWLTCRNVADLEN